MYALTNVRIEFPLTNRRKNVHTNVFPQTVFEVRPFGLPYLTLDFYLWVHLKIPVYVGFGMIKLITYLVLASNRECRLQVVMVCCILNQ